MPLGDKIKKPAEAQLVAESPKLFNALHFSGEDTGSRLAYRLHQRLVL